MGLLADFREVAPPFLLSGSFGFSKFPFGPLSQRIFLEFGRGTFFFVKRLQFVDWFQGIGRWPLGDEFVYLRLGSFLFLPEAIEQIDATG